MKTVQNVSKQTITFNKKSIRPNDHGELPDGVALKYAQRQKCIILETENKPVQPTPKTSKPKRRTTEPTEDLV